MRSTTRFPLNALETRLGGPCAAEVARVLRVSPRTVFRYRKYGLNDRQADHAAVSAGYHPAEIWPDWYAFAATR